MLPFTYQTTASSGGFRIFWELPWDEYVKCVEDLGFLWMMFSSHMFCQVLFFGSIRADLWKNDHFRFGRSIPQRTLKFEQTNCLIKKKQTSISFIYVKTKNKDPSSHLRLPSAEFFRKINNEPTQTESAGRTQTLRTPGLGERRRQTEVCFARLSLCIYI